jgi:hypothetical protein
MALVTGLYVLISGALLLRLLAGIVLVFRLSRAARLFSTDWTAGAHVRVSSSVAMPVTFASTILLPNDCASWPELKQRAVMSHEKSHIQHNDFYWLLLAALYRALFWFNPLAWRLARRLGERTAIAMARSRTMAWRIDRVLGAAAIWVRPSAGKRLLVVASVLPNGALGDRHRARRSGRRGGARRY